MVTLTIELTDEQAAALAELAANAGEPIADYVQTLVGEAALWREELTRRQSWAREVKGIRDRGLDASDLVIRMLINEGRR